MSKYDLVIYGASGFTGQFVIEYVERAAQQHQVSWAVAGWSEGRLRAALARAGAVLGTDLSRGNRSLLSVLSSSYIYYRVSPNHRV